MRDGQTPDFSPPPVASFDGPTPAAREAYRRDGVVRLRSVLEARWLDLAARGIEREIERPGRFFRDHTPPGSPGRYLFGFWSWPEVPELREVALRSPAGELAGRLMGARSVRMVMDNWFVREAGAAVGAPWHHDEPYFDFDGRLAIVWIPVERVTGDEGLAFVRGSHRWGRLFVAPQFSENVPFACEGPGYEPVPDVEREHAAALARAELERGDCLVFDFRTLHGAIAGDRPLARTVRRLTLRFAAEGAVFRPRGEWTREIAEHLAGQGLVAGGPLECPLTPLTWTARAGLHARADAR